MKITALLTAALAFISISASSEIYHNGWNDLDKSSLDDEAVHNFFWNNSTCTDLDFMAGLELGSVAPRLAVRCRVK